MTMLFTKKLIIASLFAALALTGAAAMALTTGVWFVLGTGAMLAGLLVFLSGLINLLFGLLGRRPPRGDWAVNAALLVTSLTLALAAAEAYFAYTEARAVTAAPVAAAPPSNAIDIAKLEIPLSPEAEAAMAAREGVATMPKEWGRRYVKIPGAADAYYWHNVLHVHDKSGFRRATPFPPKQDGVMRIMVIGDSMTYGYGVEEKWSFVKLLQQVLEPNYRVEIVALGQSGAQTEDIYNHLRNFAPELKPDLVVYPVCQNDFLPSGIGQYSNAMRYAFPIPESWKTFFNSRSRVSRYLDDGYDVILRSLWLRLDFFQDILKDIHGYQQRFAHDVKAINDYALSLGLPPVTAMVIDQVPRVGGVGEQITEIANKYLREAGMDVIDLHSYYQKYDKEVMMVSRWEGHPNEKAHAIFAALFRAGLERNPALAKYRKN